MSYVADILLIQGVYYALTGIWPVVHIGSFMKVTGPKRDLWQGDVTNANGRTCPLKNPTRKYTRVANAAPPEADKTAQGGT